MRIVGYHRPADIDEALGLLARPGVRSVVLGGGTVVNRHGGDEAEAVDLQALGLDRMAVADGRAAIGAMVRLSVLALSTDVPAWLRDLARRELPSTLRTVATVGGTVASVGSDSELVAGLLVADAVVSLATASARFDLPLPQYLHDRSALGAHVITSVSLAVDGNAAVSRTSRTPADVPIVSVIGRVGSDGRVRLAATGVAMLPRLVGDGAPVDPPGDFRGSADYRRMLAHTLSARVRQELEA